MKKQKNRGITLVALVITIIILLILAGITISQLTGSGLFENAKLAKEKSDEAQEQEDETLDDYENKIGGYITGNRDDNSSLGQLAGIKTDIFIKNTYSNTSEFRDKTTMDSFIRTADNENNIAKYLSYSDENGYTVLKSGWYFVHMSLDITSKSSADVNIFFLMNGVNISSCSGWAGLGLTGSDVDRNTNSFSVYLKEGDQIYFSAIGNSAASSSRTVTGICYPMF